MPADNAAPRPAPPWKQSRREPDILRSQLPQSWARALRLVRAPKSSGSCCSLLPMRLRAVSPTSEQSSGGTEASWLWDRSRRVSDESRPTSMGTKLSSLRLTLRSCANRGWRARRSCGTPLPLHSTHARTPRLHAVIISSCAGAPHPELDQRRDEVGQVVHGGARQVEAGQLRHVAHHGVDVWQRGAGVAHHQRRDVLPDPQGAVRVQAHLPANGARAGPDTTYELGCV